MTTTTKHYTSVSVYMSIELSFLVLDVPLILLALYLLVVKTMYDIVQYN